MQLTNYKSTSLFTQKEVSVAVAGMRKPITVQWTGLQVKFKNVKPIYLHNEKVRCLYTKISSITWVYVCLY